MKVLGVLGFLAMAGVSVEGADATPLPHAASSPALAAPPSPAPLSPAALPAGPATALTPTWADPAYSQVQTLL